MVRLEALGQDRERALREQGTTTTYRTTSETVAAKWGRLHRDELGRRDMLREYITQVTVNPGRKAGAGFQADRITIDWIKDEFGHAMLPVETLVKLPVDASAEGIRVALTADD